MWKCPVCDQENNAATVCPTCGFDGSCDYEHYPTSFAVTGAKSTRALRREWEQKQGPGLDQLLMELVCQNAGTAGRFHICGSMPPSAGGFRQPGGAAVVGRLL